MQTILAVVYLTRQVLILLAMLISMFCIDLNPFLLNEMFFVYTAFILCILIVEGLHKTE